MRGAVGAVAERGTEGAVEARGAEQIALARSAGSAATDTATDTAVRDGAPRLCVVRGTAGAEEVAALTALFAALAQSAGPRRRLDDGIDRSRVSWDHPGPGRRGGLGYRAPGAWTS
ncbi:acyl-CoA carboxylase epsilon subunit [Streptomyces zagrosensis]|nr:acyl-CoA carboxylase epsilon subunit [Streptomyces zagrosensis]